MYEGSSFNVMYLNLFKKLSLREADLKPAMTLLVGLNSPSSLPDREGHYGRPVRFNSLEDRLPSCGRVFFLQCHCKDDLVAQLWRSCINITPSDQILREGEGRRVLQRSSGRE